VRDKLELVHIPALVDSKYFGPRGDGEKLTLPQATVGLVSGAVRNAEHEEVLKEMREKVDILVALGTCATDGGIPAQANIFPNDDIFEKVFTDCPTHERSSRWTSSYPAVHRIRIGSPTRFWRSSTAKPSGHYRSVVSATPAR
jgi:F420-non-reducing hydrogenase small subunit